MTRRAVPWWQTTLAVPLVVGVTLAALLLVWRNADAPPDDCGPLGEVGQIMGSVGPDSDPDRVRTELADAIESVEVGDLGAAMSEEEAARLDALEARWPEIVAALRAVDPGTPLVEIVTPELVEVGELLGRAYGANCTDP